MLNKREFHDIMAAFEIIYPSPYELIVNIIKIINNYDFFNKSELCIYSNINVYDYPVISKIKMDTHAVQAIELITSVPHKDHHHLIIMFRSYLEEHLYVYLDELCPICCYQFGLTLLKCGNIAGIGCLECGFFKDVAGNNIKIDESFFYPLNNIELKNYLIEHGSTTSLARRLRLATA